MTSVEFLKKAPHSKTEIQEGIHALFQYKNILVRRAIWEIKFRGNRKIATMLAGILYDELVADVAKIKTWEERQKIILIPIPMSKERSKEKGFNQSELLVDEIFLRDGGSNFTKETETLVKTKHTPRQVSVRNRHDRLKNIEGVFAVEHPRKISDAIIFLIDDVTTTGATFAEARKVLLNAGAKEVFAYALAH